MTHGSIFNLLRLLRTLLTDVPLLLVLIDIPNSRIMKNLAALLYAVATKNWCICGGNDANTQCASPRADISGYSQHITNGLELTQKAFPRDVASLIFEYCLPVVPFDEVRIGMRFKLSIMIHDSNHAIKFVKRSCEVTTYRMLPPHRRFRQNVIGVTCNGRDRKIERAYTEDQWNRNQIAPGWRKK